MNKPLLSIASVTYNHEKYIEQAIESWLMQKTNFEIEIIIGEDHSTDNTRAIIEKYRQKHPNLIKLITSIQNVGMMPNFIRTLKACRGKYIAICEGDDHWTDPYKLQKQVDFLEGNAEYSACFHDTLMLIQDTNEFKKLNYKLEKTTFDLHDILLKGRFIQTNSFVFRQNAFKIPEWSNSILSGDQMLVALVAKNGLIKYLNETMGVYRKHKGGVSMSIKSLHFYKSNILLYLKLKNEFDKNHYRLLDRQILKWHGHVFLAAVYLKKPFVAFSYFFKGCLYLRRIGDFNYYLKDFLFDMFRKKKKITIF